MAENIENIRVGEFRFKAFAVDHSCSTMKVGTDGVLLGAWSDVARSQALLDVGCGCGYIGLMLAARSTSVRLLRGVDIDSASVCQAQHNYDASPFNLDAKAVLCDFNVYADCGVKYDLIVSNPPFFTAGVLPSLQARMNARHTSSLSLSQLIEGASRLLSPDGRLCIVTPVECRGEGIEAATMSSMVVTRLTTVYPLAGQPPKRLLWEIRHRVATAGSLACETNQIVIKNSDRNYTGSYRRLVESLIWL